MATLLAETRGAVGIARLNRPDARNALSPELMEELAGSSRAGTPTPRCAAS